MAQFLSSAPVVLVSDLPRSAAYYSNQLGFDNQTFYGSPPNFCIVRRDGLSVMLSLASAADIKPHWQIVRGMWNLYLWVNDAEAMYAELKSRGAIIDYELTIKPYGLKEFGVRDLDGHDIGIGEILP